VYKYIDLYREVVELHHISRMNLLTSFESFSRAAIFFTLIILSLSSLAFSVCPSGIVSYWKMDENGGTTVYDYLGLNNGTSYGGQSWVAGKIGTALYFDGYNDYVEVPYSTSLKMTDAVTLSAWIYFNGLPGSSCWNVVSDHSGSYNNGKILRMCNARIEFLLGPAGTATAYYTFTTQDIGKWFFVTATYNKTEGLMKMYVNGELKHTVSRTGDITVNPNPIWIGKSGWGEYYNGIIDEVAIFNRSLSASEIQALYQNSLNGYNYCQQPGAYINFVPPTPANGSTITNNYVEINSTIDITNASANLDTFKFNWNNTNYSFYDPSLVLAMNFNNNSAIGDNSLKAAYSMTASANSYLYEDLTSVSDYVIQSGDYLEYDVFWTSPTDKIAFDYTLSTSEPLRGSGAVDQNGISAHPATDLSNYAYNRWYHRKIAIPSSHVGKTITYYDIACEFDGTGIKTGYISNITITNGAGQIRKVIYDGSTNPSHSTHLVSSASLSFFSGQIAKDVSKYNNDGTLMNGVAWTQNGRFGKALSFDGVNDYVQIPRVVQDDFSILVWVKTTQTAGTGQWYNGNGIVDGEVCGVTNDFGVSLSGSKAAFGIGNPDTTIYSQTNINDGNWHFITATRQRSSGEIKIYVDGNLEATGTANTNSLTAPSWIGIGNNPCDVSANRWWFGGTIDEVRIYNRTLSADEIKMHYQSEFQKYNSSQYRFYVNITNISNGTYTYYAWANDTAGLSGQSEVRTLNVGVAPVITFVPPTPVNGASLLINSSAFINITSNKNLSIALLEWNGVNETMLGSGTNWYINKTNLAAGTYTYKVYGNDSENKWGVSETRILNVIYPPNISFIPPTPANNSVITTNYTEINTTIDTSALDTFKFNWQVYYSSSLPGWSYAKPIKISNPGSNLTDYQIQIQLSSSNFDFSKANSDGSDIRFYLENGTKLNYWIEYWNSSSQSAVIWVKVPSIPSGDSRIIMYYGNPSATSESCQECMPRILNHDFEKGFISPASACGVNYDDNIPDWTVINRNGWSAYVTDSPGGKDGSCDFAFMPSGKQGIYYAASGDSATGTWRSSKFTLMRGVDRIKFLRAGGADNGGVRVIRASDGAVLCSAQTGTDTDTFFVDNCIGLSNYAGTIVYIEVWDSVSGGWGKVAVDDFHQADSNDNTIDYASPEPTVSIDSYSIYDPSLVLAMNFNNNSAIGETATKAVDISKYGNNGTINGGAVWSSSGRFGSALSFDGSSGYVEVANSASIKSINYISAEAFVKTTAQSGMILAIGPYIEGSPYTMSIYMQNGKARWEFDGVSAGSTYQVGNKIINDGNWHHIAIVYDGSKGYLYVDGVLDVSGNYAAGPLEHASTERFTVGMRGGGYYFNGSIDEVRIYNRALSADEIKMHYQSEFQKYNSSQYRFYINVTNLTQGTYTYYAWANDTGGLSGQSEVRTLNVSISGPLVQCPSGIVSYWKMDENGGTTVYDYLGLNNGTFTNKVVWTTGKINSGVFLNGQAPGGTGSGPYINIPDSSILRVVRDITVMAWVKPVDVATWHQVVCKRLYQATDPYNSYIIDTTDTGSNNRWRFCVSNGNAGSGRCVTDTEPLTPGVWTHLAGVYDGSALKIYVNGVLKNTTDASSVGNIGYTSQSLRIGTSNTDPGQYFNGTIDEVAIFNRALSASEIQALYQNSLNGYNYCQQPGAYINFVPPTPANGSTITNNYVEINSTIDITNASANLDTFKFNWQLYYQPLSGWSYAKSIKISNPGSELTDYQIQIQLSSSNFDFSKANSDGSDIRFYLQNGTKLNYWVEYWNSSSQSAIIWVKVPSIPSGDSRIIMYYGNPSATSESNGENVFIFFDDFNRADGTDLGQKWQEYGDGNWQIVNNTAYRPEVSSGADDFALAKMNGTLLNVTDIIIESKLKVVQISGFDPHLGITARANDISTSSHRGYSLTVHNTITTLQLLDEEVAWKASTTTSQALNEWWKFKLQVNGTTMKGKAWKVGTPEPNWMVSDSSTTQSSGYIGLDAFISGTTEQYYDDFFAHKYAAVEPTVSIEPIYSIYDPSLVLAMNFNNNSAIGETATKVVDISKYGNNGTIYGGATYVDGRFGKALSFDGSSGKVVVPDSPSIRPTYNYSFEFWIQPKVWSSYNQVPFTKKRSGGSVFETTWIGSGYSPPKAFLCSFTNNTGNGVGVVTPFTLNENQWYHIVCTYNGSQITMYVNGQQVASAPFSGMLADSTGGDLGIGYSSYWNWNYFNGLIDEVRIYNRALSADEIKMHYLSEFQKYNSTQYRFYVNVTNLTQGTYTYYAWANDTSGLSGQSEVRTLNVSTFGDDVTPPVVSLVSPAPGAYLNSSSITFSFNATDDQSTTLNCSLYINNILNKTNSSVINGSITSFQVTGLTDGSYNWKINCSDQSGNSNVSETRTFIIDTIKPTVAINSPSSNVFLNSKTISINLTVSDVNLNYTNISILQGSSVINSTVSYLSGNQLIYLSVSSDGIYNISAVVYDKSNNSNSSTVTNITIDTLNPSITITSPASNSYLNSKLITINGTSSDTNYNFTNISIYQGSTLINSTITYVSTWNVQLSVPSDGVYNITATAYDKADNSNQSTIENIKVDTTAPTLSFIYPTPANNANLTVNSMTVNVSSTENLSSCILNFSGTPYVMAIVNADTNTYAYYSLSGFDFGTYNYNVTCNDTVGNAASTETRSFNYIEYIEVSVSPTSISFGSVDPLSNTTSMTPIVVTNTMNSNVPIYLTFNGSDFVSNSYSIGIGNLTMRANSVMPGAGNFTLDHSLSNIETACSASKYSLGQDCSNISIGSSVNLWFNIRIPGGQPAATYNSTITIKATGIR
jgi:hypothetical protein